jgi:hypothetical protein
LGLARLDKPTRFYVLYRWAYGGEELSFDEANKLAKSVGADLDALAAEHRLIERRSERVRVPIFAKRLGSEAFLKALQTAFDDGRLGQMPEIDHVHLLLHLWSKSDVDALAAVLGRAGVLAEEHPLWRTAQALLEVEQSAGGEVAEEATALAQLLGSKRSLLRGVAAVQDSGRQFRLFG